MERCPDTEVISRADFAIEVHKRYWPRIKKSVGLSDALASLEGRSYYSDQISIASP